MAFLTSLFEKLKTSRPTLTIYPIVIMVAVPLLLVIGTLWNLNSFNRDVNFLIRHQAASLADTLKPVFDQAISKGEDTSNILKSLVEENKELISATVLEKEGDNFKIFASSDPSLQIEEVSQDILNRFAESLNQSFAGLVYDPKLAQNVWVVTVPLAVEKEKPTILALKLSTSNVNEILSRTSKDSFIVLGVLVFITLVLLANHFFFYKKALKTQQLEEIDRLKDEFISIASHELRTPVTAVTGYLDLLKEKIPKEIVLSLEKEFVILDGLTRALQNLIGDLLEVSRIEQGRLKLSFEKADINQLITEVVTRIEPLARQKALALSYSQVKLPEVTTDPQRFTQILTNLVNNSVKYTLKGQITVTAEVKGNLIEVGVKDTGIGIPPDQMTKLFSKFHRVQDEKTRDERGTGLGLWITKQLVEALGGKIYAESIYGSGSSFTFTLPVRA